MTFWQEIITLTCSICTLLWNLPHKFHLHLIKCYCYYYKWTWFVGKKIIFLCRKKTMLHTFLQNWPMCRGLKIYMKMLTKHQHVVSSFQKEEYFSVQLCFWGHFVAMFFVNTQIVTFLVFQPWTFWKDAFYLFILILFN